VNEKLTMSKLEENDVPVSGEPHEERLDIRRQLGENREIIQSSDIEKQDTIGQSKNYTNSLGSEMVEFSDSERSIITTGNTSRAGISVMTSDETVVRRGDGAIVYSNLNAATKTSRKSSFMAPKFMPSGTSSTQPGERIITNKNSNKGRDWLCCCPFRRRISI
jgi:hypothetical protein